MRGANKVSNCFLDDAIVSLDLSVCSRMVRKRELQADTQMVTQCCEELIVPLHAAITAYAEGQSIMRIDLCEKQFGKPDAVEWAVCWDKTDHFGKLVNKHYNAVIS